MRDPRVIANHVKDSDVLLLIQSKDVLQSPWCLIELDAAITHGVPIVGLAVVGKNYDVDAAADFLLHLEANLADSNAYALEVLRMNGIDPLRLAHKLHSVVPAIVSIPFDTSASLNTIKAAMADLIMAVKDAKPLSITESFEAWRSNRCFA